MRIAFVADGRAEHARRWIRYFAEAGDDILLVSTFPAAAIPGVRQDTCPGVVRAGTAFQKILADHVFHNAWRRGGVLLRVVARSQHAYSMWQTLRVLEVPWQAASARRAVEAFRPEVVHAMRVQCEGYITARLNVRPWILSVWGADFMLFSRTNPLQRWMTARTIQCVDALTADCQRDLDTARRLGLPPRAPARFFPGNGGVNLASYRMGVPAADRSRLVVCARGVAPYIRLDTMFRAFRRLLEGGVGGVRLVVVVQTAFVEVVRKMALKEGLCPETVDVRSFMGPQDWVELLRHAAVLVSPSLVDGTPNSMLEGMACGAFPVMSRLDSIAEWVEDGVNGFLFDARDPQELASCLSVAMEDTELRRTSQELNRALVGKRADQSKVMPDVRELYRELASTKRA